MNISWLLDWFTKQELDNFSKQEHRMRMQFVIANMQKRFSCAEAKEKNNIWLLSWYNKLDQRARMQYTIEHHEFI